MESNVYSLNMDGTENIKSINKNIQTIPLISLLKLLNFYNLTFTNNFNSDIILIDNSIERIPYTMKNNLTSEKILINILTQCNNCLFVLASAVPFVFITILFCENSFSIYHIPTILFSFVATYITLKQLIKNKRKWVSKVNDFNVDDK